MKFRISWIIGLIFTISVFMGFFWIFTHILFAIIFNVPVTGLPEITFLWGPLVCIGLIVISTLISFIFNYINGSSYEQKVKLPLDKFIIHEYSNLTVFALEKGEFAWVCNKYTYSKLKAKDLKYIPGINYYNKDKKFLEFKLLIQV